MTRGGADVVAVDWPQGRVRGPGLLSAHPAYGRALAGRGGDGSIPKKRRLPLASDSQDKVESRFLISSCFRTFVFS